MLTITKASAGAGKTFLLTETYIGMLYAAHLSRNAHRRILAVTFTKKATAEMKERIVRELHVLSSATDCLRSPFAAKLMHDFRLTEQQLHGYAQKILSDLLQDYGAFAVSTIDSFFQQVIRSFARELNLSGKYNIELDTQVIQQMAVDDFFHYLSADDKQTYRTLLAIIDDNLTEAKPWDPKTTLITLTNELFNEAVIRHQDELFTFLQQDEVLDAYQQQLRQVQRSYTTDYQNKAQAITQYLTQHGLARADFSRGEMIFKFVDYSLDDAIKNSPKLNSYLCKFIGGDSMVKSKEKNTALYMHEEQLRPLMLELYAMLTGKRMHELITARAILYKLPYLRLLGKIHHYIQIKNEELNRLPISETNALLHNVIEQDNTSPFVYEKIGTRIQHFLIDEFQDTSYLQWENFRPLIENALGTDADNLIVGDVKQSIYRFRNSDYSLMLHQLDKDFPHQTEHRTLQYNWRSSEQVVDFNNQLFGHLAAALSAEIDTCLAGKYAPLQGIIQDVYTEHIQTPALKDKAAKGYVEVRLVEGSKKAEWREAILQQLPSIVADIEQRNIPLGRVACLVRTNSDALLIAQTLVEAGYQVMSNEGLLLTSSPAVQFIIATLRANLYPEDNTVLFHQAYFAEQLGIVVRTKPMQQMSLLETVQHIIAHYGLEQPEHTPYLIALQDKVYEYINRYAADVYDFLTWWDTHANAFSLTMQATPNAIQIVSIHKSKGLEYDVVIIPFCDWSKAKSQSPNTEELLWVKPTDEISVLFGVPLVPIKFADSLAQSDFADTYYKELVDLHLDNLNLTYVAFTRARQELYICAPAMSKSQKPSNIGHVIGSVLQNNACDLICETTNEAMLYHGGSKETRVVSQAVQPTDEIQNTAHLTHEDLAISTEQRATIRVNLPSRQIFDTPEDESLQTIGVIMHQILQQVRQAGDEQQVIDTYLQNGVLQAAQLPIIQQQFADFWSLIHDQQKEEWFDMTQYHVLNEQDILLPNGTTKRPDRILLTGQKAVIIDYKFGHIESPQYEKQVQGYKDLLHSMGYEVTGYLCYVKLHKIVQV